MATTIIEDKFGSKILTAIEDTIRADVEERFENMKTQLLKDMEEAKERVVAQAVIKIHEHVRIEDYGNKLTIEVIKTKELLKSL